MGKHALWMASVQCLAKSLVFVAVIPKSTTKNHFSPAYHSLFFSFLLYNKWRLFSFWSFLSTGRYDVNFCIFHCKDCKNVFSPLDSSNLIQAGYWPGSISNTKYVFSQDLFFKWDLLQKRLPGSSESGFLRSLEDFAVIRGRVSSFSNAYWISNGKIYNLELSLP